MKTIINPNAMLPFIKIASFIFLISLIQACDDEKTSVKECGFQGVVTMSNNQPVVNAILTFSRIDEKDVTVVKTDAEGAYAVILEPGDYTITVTATGLNSDATDPIVLTSKGGYLTKDFLLETELASGFWGVVWDINNNPISTTVGITFSNSASPFLVYSTFSNNGSYKINLPQGSYYARAEAVGYQVYDTTPGLLVVIGSNYQTGNFFLTPQ